jgi:chromate transporter
MSTEMSTENQTNTKARANTTANTTNKEKKTLLSLFLAFLKIGAFTFGGGYAMIALIENEFVSKKKWITQPAFLDMIAIAESTPGPIAINSATYIGYTCSGLLGSIVATIAVCIPSFAIIYAISLFFNTFLSLTYVAYAFKGIRVCVVYLIASAGIKLLKSTPKTPINLAIITLVTVCMVTFSILAISFSSIYYILICAVLGLALYAIQRVKEDK